mmetsp:Transcript_72931/g.131391  ORF Transcript_72931/g.131391 Transcript_72931/m.131391 type:complete len:246 (+) Transcript_72931:302-1039(+)
MVGTPASWAILRQICRFCIWGHVVVPALRQLLFLQLPLRRHVVLQLTLELRHLLLGRLRLCLGVCLSIHRSVHIVIVGRVGILIRIRRRRRDRVDWSWHRVMTHLKTSNTTPHTLAATSLRARRPLRPAAVGAIVPGRGAVLRAVFVASLDLNERALALKSAVEGVLGNSPGACHLVESVARAPRGPGLPDTVNSLREAGHTSVATIELLDLGFAGLSSPFSFDLDVPFADLVASLAGGRAGRPV